MKTAICLAIWPDVRITGIVSMASVTSGKVSPKYEMNGNDTEGNKFKQTHTRKNTFDWAK